MKIVTSVSVLGPAIAWLVGWRRGKQAYQRLHAEELTKEWKDYYQVLRISPSAESKAITEAYKRLVHIYHNALSDKTKTTPVYSLMLTEINEAYQILSDPATRSAYDRTFWLRQSAESTEIEESVKGEIVDLAQTTASYVAKTQRRITWGIPAWGKTTQQVVLATVIALFLVLFGGTSLAFAQPEHTLAAPFREVAVTLTKASTGAISLINDVRGVTAMYERSIVSTALQAMRIDEGLEEITPLTVSTNDMAGFPSPEHCLFPDYLEKRFSQFKYTVDSGGAVDVDTSWAITDAFLEKTKQLLNRLEEENKN